MTNQKPDRAQTIDRLLAARAARTSDDPTDLSRRSRVAAKADACLDADTLAAWADDALDARARAAAEAHAADCARCLAMLAAMARTAPTRAAAPWWRPALRWVVPLTAAAAAVLVWAIVPERAGRVAVRQVSESAETTAPPSMSIPPSAKEPAPVAAAPPPSNVSPTARRDTPTLAEAKDDLSRRSAETAKVEQKGPASADAKALADSSERSADLSRRSADGAKAEGANAADKKSPDRVRAAAESAAAPSATPAQPMAKTFSFGAPETIIVSSNPASRWRILQGGQVQHSADGGATWQTQTTGVSETLSGGSSPSPSVCWLVGPKGIVLRTTDGRSWTRVPFPQVVPLASVRATDVQMATVTTEDGRQFVTADGGRTWARKPD